MAASPHKMMLMSEQPSPSPPSPSHKTTSDDSIIPLASAIQAKLARQFRFFYLVAGILFFFGCHNYMQELIMSLPGFKVGASVKVSLSLISPAQGPL